MEEVLFIVLSSKGLNIQGNMHKQKVFFCFYFNMRLLLLEVTDQLIDLHQDLLCFC